LYRDADCLTVIVLVRFSVLIQVLLTLSLLTAAAFFVVVLLSVFDPDV